LKIVRSCRQSLQKPKLTFIVLLVLVSFLAGAGAERTTSFLQDVTAVLPQVQDTIKTFIREKMVFKLNTWAESRGGVSFSLSEGSLKNKRMIRGP